MLEGGLEQGEVVAAAGALVGNAKASWSQITRRILELSAEEAAFVETRVCVGSLCAWALSR